MICLHWPKSRTWTASSRSWNLKPPKTTPERLQKLMAAAGLGSRRGLEKQIAEGNVRVNGEKAELGRTVTTGDTIAFDDKSWRVVSEPVLHRTLIYNKPEGELTSRSDPEGRKTVFDRLPRVKNARWVAIGRLDMNTTGLLLLTTDGELAHAMMHPSSNVDREYACRIRGKASEEQLQHLKDGVELDDGPASFSDIQEAGGTGENYWYHVTIMEGRNREVRRLWESQGLTVSRLKRVRYGAAFLPKRLRMGQWSELSPRDHEVLRSDIGLPAAPSGLSLKQPPGSGRGKPGRAGRPDSRKKKQPRHRKPRNQRRR
ncbi:MAG: pseudouridine synthase [Xanthomonadales bacterium]|nr:pseudouridine synthase [Gammaproteobacteria bacterium]NND56452.1 pseudouridine synthase [Xanthomonadales bacterium]NNK51147.1 pseudouridine synthase [Xanthomonadales bacterium]